MDPPPLLGRLRSLVLQRCDALNDTDAMMLARSAPALRTLCVADCALIGSAGLQACMEAHWRQLEAVTLINTAGVASGLACALAALPQLSTLEVGAVQVGAVQLVARRGAARRIVLLDDRGGVHGLYRPHRDVQAFWQDCSQAALQALLSHTKLRHVEVYGCVHACPLPASPRVPQQLLRKLGISFSQAAPEVQALRWRSLVAGLANAPGLQELRVVRLPELHDDLPGMVSATLTKLELSSVRASDDTLQDSLRGCPALQHLYVSDVGWDASDMRGMRALTLAHKRLQHLEIRSDSLASLTLVAPNLQQATLKDCGSLHRLDVRGDQPFKLSVPRLLPLDMWSGERDHPLRTLSVTCRSAAECSSTATDTQQLAQIDWGPSCPCRGCGQLHNFRTMEELHLTGCLLDGLQVTGLPWLSRLSLDRCVLDGRLVVCGCPALTHADLRCAVGPGQLAGGSVAIMCCNALTTCTVQVDAGRLHNLMLNSCSALVRVDLRMARGARITAASIGHAPALQALHVPLLAPPPVPRKRTGTGVKGEAGAASTAAAASSGVAAAAAGGSGAQAVAGPCAAGGGSEAGQSGGGGSPAAAAALLPSEDLVALGLDARAWAGFKLASGSGAAGRSRLARSFVCSCGKSFDTVRRAVLHQGVCTRGGLPRGGALGE